jgi:hypothetical protein
VWEQLESGEAEAKSSRAKDVAFAANRLIWLIFAVELALILAVAPRRWRRCARTGSMQ